MRLSDVRDYGYAPDKVELMNYIGVEEHATGNGSVETSFNLNDGVVVEGLQDMLNSPSVKRYTCRSGDDLRFISYREYGSIHYWWLIAKVNGISDALEPLEGGRVLYLLSREHMNYIVNLISSGGTDD